jgi:hypothetical protein
MTVLLHVFLDLPIVLLEKNMHAFKRYCTFFLKKTFLLTSSPKDNGMCRIIFYMIQSKLFSFSKVSNFAKIKDKKKDTDK